MLSRSNQFVQTSFTNRIQASELAISNSAFKLNDRPIKRNYMYENFLLYSWMMYKE